ncbi:MAG: efflux RND transporter permease subunit [Spirochaetaceae bacterium]|jgi:multidrug efflux pump subunit AcrB|nr:efflux RND transporter permease subunit [Spirochaetaceae bacterium]
MKNLIRACVSRPVTVVCSLAVLFLGLLVAVSRMPLNRLPEIEFPRVLVETSYYGMSAADIRHIVTIPLEDALSAVKGLEGIKSVSRDGASIVVLDFRWGTTVASAAVLVREAVDSVYAALPQGVAKPVVTQGDPGLDAHAILAVEAKSGDRVLERNLAEYEMRSRIRRAEGAGEVMLAGGEREEAVVGVNVPRAIMRGFRSGDIAQMLAMESADIPAGNAREGNVELVVVSEGRPDSVEGLSRLVLNGGESPLFLDDVAEVGTEPAKQQSVFLYRGKEMTALEVYRRPGADPVRLSRDIRKIVSESQKDFARDADIHLVYDASPSIVQGLLELGFSAALGAFAVIVIVVLFIRNFRYSILVSLSIPVSAAAAFSLLALLGRSLNSMSLSGIALGIGLVSDTSVIVLDVLCRRFGKRGFAPTPERPSPEETAETVAAISLSSFGGAMTTIVVFVPVIFLPGALGALFGDMAVTIAVSVFSGWVYAQFALPALFRAFFKSATRPSRRSILPPGIAKVMKVATGTAGLDNFYATYLRRAVRNTRKVLIAAAVLSAAGFVVLVSRPAAFVAKDAAREIMVSVAFPSGLLLERAAEEAAVAAGLLEKLPGVDRVFAHAGAEEADVKRRSSPDYKKEEFIFRVMLSKEADPAALLRTVQKTLEETPAFIETRAFFPPDPKEKVLGLSEGERFAATAKSADEAREKARDAIERLRGNRDAPLESAVLRPSGERRELRILPKREALAQLGINNADIAEAAMGVTEGTLAARLEIEGRPLDVRVRGTRPEAVLPPLQTIASIPVRPAQGNGPVFVGTVGIVKEEFSPESLARLDRNDAVYIDVTAKTGRERALRKVFAEQCAKSDGVIRADETVFAKYRVSLAVTIALVVVLLYLTMGAQFESWTMPLVLMLSIPFSLAGAGPALLFSGAELDSGAVIGIVTLFGIVVNNGIVLYETSIEHIAAGMAVPRAVYCGARERFQPVLATTLTTAIVLLPLIFSSTAASQKAMAAAMLGGIIASTTLTLFALPAVFMRVLHRGSRG